MQLGCRVNKGYMQADLRATSSGLQLVACGARIGGQDWRVLGKRGMAGADEGPPKHMHSVA